MTDDLAVARHERRIDYLDGLRGLGALSVVLYHFAVVLVPVLGTDALREITWATTGPMLLVTNGSFYVKAFFILSGYVLANSVASGPRPLASSIISRYFRLTVPMTVALLCTWLIGITLPHPPLENLPRLMVFLPSATDSIREGLWGVYRHGPPAANFALWTMQYELIGSLAIYAVYKGAPRYRMTLLLALGTVFLLRVNLLGFAVGAILRELHYADRVRWSAWWGWIAGLAYLYFGCDGRLGIKVSTSPRQGWFEQYDFFGGLFFTFGAMGLIYLLLTVPFWQRSLRTRPCQFLAHVSFGLYLIHYPLAYPVAELYPWLPGPLPMRLTVLLAVFLTCSLGLGWLLTILVDDPLILMLKRWKKGWLSRLTADRLFG